MGNICIRRIHKLGAIFFALMFGLVLILNHLTSEDMDKWYDNKSVLSFMKNTEILNVTSNQYPRSNAMDNNRKSVSLHSNTTKPKERPPVPVTSHSKSFPKSDHTDNACEGKRVELVICVTVARNAADARQAVRETWGSPLMDYGSNNDIKNNGSVINSSISSSNNSSSGKKIILYFFVGEGSQEEKNHENITRQLDQESKMHRDIVKDTLYIDSYNNLTLKSVSAVRWVGEKCPHAEFMLKVDADVFVNIPRLLKRLREVKKKLGETSSFIFGNTLLNQKPKRTGANKKWHVSLQDYPSASYPDYVNGGAYAISRGAYSGLVKATYKLRPFFLEDVYIAGLCRTEAGAVLKKERLGWSRYFEKNMCAIKKYSFVHGYKPNDLRQSYKNLMKNKCS